MYHVLAMHSFFRPLTLLLVLCLFGFLSACDSAGSGNEEGNDDSNFITYRVTGDAETAGISYHVPTGPNSSEIQAETNASLPWESENIDLSVGTGDLTARLDGEGTIRAQILDSNENVLEEEAASGSNATVRATFSFD